MPVRPLLREDGRSAFFVLAAVKNVPVLISLSTLLERPRRGGVDGADLELAAGAGGAAVGAGDVITVGGSVGVASEGGAVALICCSWTCNGSNGCPIDCPPLVILDNGTGMCTIGPTFGEND